MNLALPVAEFQSYPLFDVKKNKKNRITVLCTLKSDRGGGQGNFEL